MDIWNGRKKLLAKNLMDTAKIIIAAAFASEFFLKFPFQIKTAIYAFLLANIIGAFFIHPKGED